MDSLRSLWPFGSVKEKREAREELELNKDDRRLAELLGIDIGQLNVRGKNALKVETVYACIRILSESVAKLPLKVHQEDEHGVQRTAKHELHPKLKLRPNPYMSASDFWKCIEAQRNVYGNAYVNLEFNRRTGQIEGMWPIDSPKVKIMVDTIGHIDQTTRLWYEVDVGGGVRRKVMPEAMLHFKGGITLNGIVGISPLNYLQATVENAAASTKFLNNFFKQGLQVKGVIQYVGEMDEPKKKAFREQFESMSSGLKNSHRIALMPFGYQFTPLALTMADAQFLENNELTIRQLAAAYGIKMHQLNDLSKSTHTNITEQQRQFYTDTLQAILTSYEQEMTYKLFLPRELDAGYFVRFNVDAILRADIKTRYDAHRTGVQGSFITPNEARAWENLPPLAGGDILIANGNIIPLTQVGAQYKRKKGGEGTGQQETEADDGKGEAGADGDA